MDLSHDAGRVMEGAKTRVWTKHTSLRALSLSLAKREEATSETRFKERKSAGRGFHDIFFGGFQKVLQITKRVHFS